MIYKPINEKKRDKIPLKITDKTTEARYNHIVQSEFNKNYGE